MALRAEKRTLTNERDLQMITFLWRWKLSTTKAISARFFPGSSPVIAYNRLLELKKAGYVRVQPFDFEGRRFVWTLCQKGFQCFKNHLPELREEGFVSENLEHDLYVTAVHLGDWLASVPEGVEMFSEQELRRLHFDHYPSWVPKTADRRPDGYWRIRYKGQFLIMALEVELTPKVGTRYDTIGQFYSALSSISRVVWVVRSHGMAKAMQVKFKQQDKENFRKHNFVIIEDFKQFGWKAPIYLGYEQGRTLSFALGVRQQSEVGQPVGSGWGPTSTPLLDTRIYPGDSRTLGNSTKSRFVDRMASRPSSHLIQVMSERGTINVHVTK